VLEDTAIWEKLLTGTVHSIGRHLGGVLVFKKFKEDGHDQGKAIRNTTWRKQVSLTMASVGITLKDVYGSLFSRYTATVRTCTE